MKLITTLVPLCALLLPCALKASSFEGTVTESITTEDSKDGPQSVSFSMKEGFMRMDMMTAKGGGGFITDFKNKQMIILMPQQKMYMVRAMPDPTSTPKPSQAGAPAANEPDQDYSFKDTGIKETILGYDCEKYEITSKRGVTDIWATDELGTFGGVTMMNGMRGRSQQAQQWESIIKGSGFFPLRVVSMEGKKRFKMEVTNVQKTHLSDSFFAAPDDWRKFDIGSMMGGALQGLIPGHSDGSN
jgi:Domain of unknown function (DUF4412)